MENRGMNSLLLVSFLGFFEALIGVLENDPNTCYGIILQIRKFTSHYPKEPARGGNFCSTRN